ncbi:MAG: hypothetical protein ACK41T_02305 [Pseudobdellovibrio sp.]
MKKFIVILLSINLYSCADKLFENKNQNQTENQDITLKILSRENIKITYLATHKSNTYNVELSWPEFDGLVNIREENSDKYINDEPIKSNKFLIKDMLGGSEVTYILETYNLERNLRKQIGLKLLPPKDLVLSGIVSLSQDTKYIYDKVIISDNTEIYSNQYNLEIKFNELVIGNNVIISHYPTNQVAVVNQHGRDGGSISFNGRFASGYLKIVLNSEKGTNGEQGFPRCLSFAENEFWHDCYGTSGGNTGKRGQVYIDLEDSTQFDYNFEFQNIEGGSKGEKLVNIDRSQRDRICRAWQAKSNIEQHKERFNKCDKESVNGLSASGGKLCIKLNKGSDYDCKEQN